ncbi:uncharacterized protein LOC132032574 isoform X2 [Lycium ferocissimum]|uniref:uncharacterized protein LOC132032574 isoform X2 n=1 Tax=Lycium ferocissimum TaxID=112874 RepID=UPI002815A1E0|nr:uncharacterized protein LOC132032574 isoform X2 [Lycium ferocissimum]
MLAEHIYSQEQKSINIFADDSSSAVNPSYIRSWLDLLSTTPRVAPFLSKNDPLIKALEKVASVTFDLLLLLVLGSYLITLFSFLFITPRVCLPVYNPDSLILVYKFYRSQTLPIYTKLRLKRP